MQATLVLVKPDGVARGLIGEVVSRLEQKGLKITAMRMMTLDRATAERHYEEHVDKPFFGELVAFITSAPLVALRAEGPDAVRVVRKLLGATNPVEAEAGTIRGDFGLVVTENLAHGSDSEASAERELGIFFPQR